MNEGRTSVRHNGQRHAKPVLAPAEAILSANRCPNTGDDPFQSGFRLLSTQTTGDDGGVVRSFREQALTDEPLPVHGDSRQSEADSMAVRTALGYEPTVSLREGPTDRFEFGLPVGREEHRLVAHRALDAAVQPEIDLEQLVAHQPDRAVDLPL